MNIEQLAARVSALETENNQLKAANLELSAEVERWKPDRVQVVQANDIRTAADFANPKQTIKQFQLSDVSKMESGQLSKAIQAHLAEQLPGLKGKISKGSYSSLTGGLYTNSMVGYILGESDWLRKQSLQKLKVAATMPQRFGFVPFVQIPD